MQFVKIISVVGARPNFMKVGPLHRAFLEDDRIQSVIVHTGQHYDERMSQVFFDQLGLPKPDHYLGIGGGTHTQQTAKIMLAFEEVVEQEQPDLVVVVGDVNSTVACALVAVKKGIKVAHVEAGLRSGDRSMPEEINRIVTDSISDLLFVSEQSGIDNLQAEGIAPAKIHFVGNVMIDSLVYFLPQADQLDISTILMNNTLDSAPPREPLDSASSAPPRETLDSASSAPPRETLDSAISASPRETLDSAISASPRETPRHILMTMHRPSNVDHEEGLSSILSIIQRLADKHPVIFAVHPRTRKNLEKFGMWETLARQSNLHLTAPLGYLEFVKLMKEASLVVTDSGGIQEETTYLQVPCITFRSSTERPSTVEVGSNRLISELDVETVRQQSEELLDGTRRKSGIPELWDGQAAGRIRDLIVQRLSEEAGHAS